MVFFSPEFIPKSRILAKISWRTFSIFAKLESLEVMGRIAGMVSWAGVSESTNIRSLETNVMVKNLHLTNLIFVCKRSLH